MKRILSSVIGIIMLISIYSNLIIVAESEEKYYNVQIPIFMGTTQEFSTEMLNGITTSQEQEKGEIFISIKDFQNLSNTEIIKSDNTSIDLKRNTVSLKLYINSQNADLSLGYDNDSIKSFEIYVPLIKYKNEFYISLIHGLDAFSIEMNIIGEEDISNMVSVNKQVINDNYMKSSIDYLNKKIFNFEKYSKYLQISKSQPFDEFFSKYNYDTSKYLFSWQSLSGLNDFTTSLGAIPSNFITNYDGLSDFVVGSYEEDERYYDILCTIINNEKSSNNLDFSIAYNTITFLYDTGITDTIVNENKVISFLVSSVSDCMKASEKTVNLIRCSEFQKNVLGKTILNSYKLNEEMIDDKVITDLVNFSIFNKYINNTYLSALYNNQYALYKSADKLNKDIGNSIKNISIEWYSDMIYKTLTSITDEGLNVVTGGATEIPDILMKNIKYNNAINKSILEPSEVLGNVKDCYFIQETLKNSCELDIFNKAENSYYNFKLMLQSSLTAYEILKENDTLMKIVGERGQNLINEKIKNINSILESIEICDITFYSTSNVSNDTINIEDISIMIVPIEDEIQSTEIEEIIEIPTESENTGINLKVETRKLTDNDIKTEWQHVISLDFEYPIFKTSDNSLKKFLDTSVTNEILRYMMTESDYNLFINGGFEYDMSIDGYLSIDGWIINHPEGGQGLLGCENYTFFVDLKNRKILSLKDLFSESEDLVYNEIREKAHNYSDKNVVWESSLSNYDYENCKFLLNKDKLTLIFSPYEVSSGAAGTVKIEIPLSDLNLSCTVSDIKTRGFKGENDEPSEEKTGSSSVSDYDIFKAVNQYLEENCGHLGIWLSDSNPYCPAGHMYSNDTNWSCPINTDWDSYSSNEMAGAYPHFVYVDKSTLKCTITANYETVVEFDLNDYIN